MIEQNTTSAAKLKIRSPSAIGCPRIRIENVIVATPLGPNQAMNALVAVSTFSPTSEIQIAIGRASSSVKATIPTAAQPSPNRPSSVSSEPKTTKIPSLTISTMSDARSENVCGEIGAADAERDRADEHGDEAVAARLGDRQAVGRERHAEHVERLVVVGDAVEHAASARHQPRRNEAEHDAEGEARGRRPGARTRTRRSRLAGDQRGAEGEHGRQRQAIVQPRLEVEGMAHEPRHARVGHHARREHRVGRREKRAEQERLGPRQVGERVRDERDQRAGDRHAERELAHRQPPRLLQHLGLDLEPVAEQDHDQRDRREVLDERRLGVEASTSRPPSPSTKPATTKTAVIDRKLRCASPEASAPTISSPPKTSVDDLEIRHGPRQRTLRARCETPLPRRSGSTAPRPAEAPPLEGDVEADLAIVGGGFTGLWAAVLAKRERPDREVVLLEAETAGWGASGRNGGFVDASLTHGLPNGASRFPRELDALEELGPRQPRATSRPTSAALGIDAAWQETGVLSVATQPHELDRPRRGGRAAAPLRLGGRGARPRRDPRRGRLAHLSRRASCSTPASALVDPGALALGLRRAALALGVRIYERTPVVSATSGALTHARRRGAGADASCSPPAPTSRSRARSAGSSRRSTTTCSSPSR